MAHNRLHFHFTTYQQALHDVGPVTWLIPHLIEEGGFMAIAGAPGSGKSFLATDLAVSLAAGENWLDHPAFTPARKCKVLYLSPEGIRSTLGRIHEQFTRRNLDPKSVDLLVSRDNLSGAKSEDYQALEDLEPDVIFVDTWSRAIPGVEENSASQVNAIIAELDYVRDVTGCAIIIVHHTTLEKARMRGTSALKGAVDTELLVEDFRTKGEGITMRVDKHKNAPEWLSPLPFDISPSPVVDGVGYAHLVPATPQFGA